jgi:E2/UBC family protein B
MPDSDSVLDRHRAEATSVLSSFIETLPAARELLAHELRVYADRDFTVGWRVTVEFSDMSRRLDILVGPDFPFEAVRFALVDRPEFLTWPHVERDGLLCLLQNNSNADHGRPVATFQNLLGKAHRLIEECIAGTNAGDFEAEFETYWNYTVSDGTKPCRSLLTLDEKNRVVSIWRGKDFDLVADGPGQIVSWLTHRFGQCKSSEFEDAAIVWVPQAMRPDRYPKTASDIYRHAQRVRATQILSDIAGEKADRISLLLGAITANGPVLAGVTIRNPKQKDVLGRSTNVLTRGFRPGHAFGLARGIFCCSREGSGAKLGEAIRNFGWKATSSCSRFGRRARTQLQKQSRTPQVIEGSMYTDGKMLPPPRAGPHVGGKPTRRPYPW